MAKTEGGTKKKGKKLNARSLTAESLADSLDDVDILGNARNGSEHTSGSEMSNSSISLSKLENTPYKPKRKGSLDSEVSTPSNLSKDENNSYNRSSPWSGKRGSSKCSNASSNQSEMRVFSSYLAIKEVQKGLKKGELIEGILRINPKKYEDAYITAPDGLTDIYLSGVQSRNGALNGDEVVIQLNLPTSWKVIEENLEAYSFTNEDLKLLNAPVSAEELQNLVSMNFGSFSNAEASITKVVKIDEQKAVCEAELLKTDIDDNLSKSPAQSDEDCSEDNASSNTTLNCNKNKKSRRGKRKKKTIANENSASVAENELLDSTYVKLKTESLNVSIDSNLSQSVMDNFEELNIGDDLHHFAPISKDKCLKNKGLEERFSLGYDKIETTVKQNISFTVAQLLRHPNWPRFVQRMGKVVYISKKVHPRVAAGYLKLMPDKNPNVALFSPKDHCIPRMKIPKGQCPVDFFSNPHYYEKYLFLAKIQTWNQVGFALGHLIDILGEKGDIETETKALLLENAINTQDFPYEELNLPSAPWTIPEGEFDYRQDLRNQCIFTIDPSTARDLDDALSCELLPSGHLQIGVHIADVSYFVELNSRLDEEAIARGTSVYLVDKVIPMLPRILCDNLCSLNPNEDRLAFSFIAILTAEGDIVEEHFTRSVIRSCVKLSYDHAQEMIEERGELDPLHFPEITNGFSLSDVHQKVLMMNILAHKLRDKRFKGGALSLDLPQLSFCLDQTSSLPLGFHQYERKDSHRLVEDFMLLANMRVAEYIHKHYPDVALLRKHPSPATKTFNDTCNLLASVGIHIPGASASALMSFLQELKGDDILSNSRLSIIMNMIAKTMKLAKYFCANSTDDPNTFRHYALNVPFYTHFTSPIRRYPDIIVHRMLATTLGYKEASVYASDQLSQMTETLNIQKQRAKMVSDTSREIFLGSYIKSLGTFNDVGMVCNVLDKAFDVHIPNMACTRRVYINQLDLDSFTMEKQNRICILKLLWNPLAGSKEKTLQTITLFTFLKVICSVKTDLVNFNVVIPHPLSCDDKDDDEKSS